MNEVIEDLKCRFNPQNLVFVGGFFCIPVVMRKYMNVWKEKMLKFMTSYADDMPNISSCRAELECWETFWKNFTGDLPETVETTLKYMITNMFPNIYERTPTVMFSSERAGPNNKVLPPRRGEVGRVEVEEEVILPAVHTREVSRVVCRHDG